MARPSVGALSRAMKAALVASAVTVPYGFAYGYSNCTWGSRCVESKLRENWNSMSDEERKAFHNDFSTAKKDLPAWPERLHSDIAAAATWEPLLMDRLACGAIMAVLHIVPYNVFSAYAVFQHLARWECNLKGRSQLEVREHMPFSMFLEN